LGEVSHLCKQLAHLVLLEAIQNNEAVVPEGSEANQISPAFGVIYGPNSKDKALLTSGAHE
jgi:hypothetical protein